MICYSNNSKKKEKEKRNRTFDRIVVCSFGGVFIELNLYVSKVGSKIKKLRLKGSNLIDSR